MATPSSRRRLPSPLRCPNSRIGVSSYPPFLPLLLLLVSAASAAASSEALLSQSLYSYHCNSTVPESTTSTEADNTTRSFYFNSGYYSGANEILTDDPTSPFHASKSVYFNPRGFYKTQTPGIIQVEGSLVFRGSSVRFHGVDSTPVSGGGRGRRLLRFVTSPRAIRSRWGRMTLSLSGFWSKSTGMLCMVGDGFGRSSQGTTFALSSVFKIHFPKRSNISNSFVAGTVESLSSTGDPNYFSPIKVLAYAPGNYEYTLTSQAEKMNAGLSVEEEALGFGEEYNICSLLNRFSMFGGFGLEFGDDCQSKNCNPVGGTVSNLPDHLSLGDFQCSEDGFLHSYLVFLNSSDFSYRGPFLEPEMTFVGEGRWDKNRNRVSLVACRVMNFKGSHLSASVDDCSIGVSLWFPKFLTIKERSFIAGRIFSNRSSTDPGYFETISFHDLGNSVGAPAYVKYNFTEIEHLNKSCPKNNARKSSGKIYPGFMSFRDLGFHVSATNHDGNHTWGYVSPLSIGETIYDNFLMRDQAMPSQLVAEMNHSVWNISYKINLGYPYTNASLSLRGRTDISAEGTYDSYTGVLCMVGCRSLSSSDGKHVLKKMDCGITINIQLSPLHPKEKGDHISGTIQSTRQKSDPLYFKPLEISSYAMYTAEAAENIWRMDIEITMVLISLTLSCAFIGLQLFHVKRHPDVLPSISLMMLAILSLGYMIPLVLNFEAFFFMNRNRQNVLLWSGGWLEVNEVIVRLVTMVAFLLQVQLLQLACSARSTEEGKKDLWVAERKSLQLYLPLYFIGILIAWFVHLGSHEALMFGGTVHGSLWEELISYAGLVVDGFLLPQIILNMIWNSKDKALAPAFYIGMTAIRALPHVYDAYRAHHYIPRLRSSYIYASPDGDFYSSAWDIIIPCGGLILTLVIYLQQRFGGSCILPPRYRKPGSGYETVPVVIG